MFVRVGVRSSRFGLGGVFQMAQQLQYWSPAAAFSTKREALNQAQREAADTRAVNVSAAQTAVGIAVVGAIAGTVMYKYGDMQDYEEFETGIASSPESLLPNEFQKFKLREVIEVNYNTSIYRFNLARASQKLELPVSSFLLARAPIGEDGKNVIRPYTPINNIKNRGCFDLLIKSYPQGNLSKHISSLSAGDFVEFKGPIKKIPYEPNKKKSIGMVAGGTGITPMLQVIEQGLMDPNDSTVFHLVFANVEKEDILLLQKLEFISKMHPNRVKVHYVLEKPPPEWTGSTGYVTADVIKEYLPAPSDDSMVFVCGPPPMMAAISGDKAKDKSQGELSGILAELGYKQENVFKF